MTIWLSDKYDWCIKQAWPRNGLSFFPSGRQTVYPLRLGVGHSTETTGFPGYRSGNDAPHTTIDLRSGEVREHVPGEWGSRCLAVSTGGVTDRTVNISGVYQVEVIGAVTPGYPARYGHYDLVNAFPGDERAQFFLARLFRAIHDTYGVPLRTSGYAHFQMYPASYGVHNRRRLSSAQFRDAKGWVGHQHAPANSHGDGVYGLAINGTARDLEKVLAQASAMDSAVGGPPDYRRGPNPDNNFNFPPEQIEHAQELLNLWDRLGIITLPEPLDVDGSLGPLTMTAVRKSQIAMGFSREEQDGLPGPATNAAWRKLMSKIEKQLEQITADLATLKGRREAPTVRDIATAVWSHAIYGFTAHWWVRRGSLGTRTDHANYPADPGSPADLDLRVAEKVLGEDVTPYDGTQKREPVAKEGA